MYCLSPNFLLFVYFYLPRFFSCLFFLGLRKCVNNYYLIFRFDKIMIDTSNQSIITRPTHHSFKSNTKEMTDKKNKTTHLFLLLYKSTTYLNALTPTNQSDRKFYFSLFFFYVDFLLFCKVKHYAFNYNCFYYVR